jgi:hypothetical protein
VRSRLGSQQTWTILVALCFACAAPKQYQTTFSVPRLQMRDVSQLTKDGVTIGVAPITRSNVKQSPLATNVYWREPDLRAPVNTTLNRAPQTMALRSALVHLVPLPAFAIGVANNTSSDLALSQLQVDVTDDKQRQYFLLTSSRDVKARFVEDMSNINPYIVADRSASDKLMTKDMDLMTQIDRLPILTPDVVIPAGQTWQGFLILDVDAHNSHQYYRLMSSIRYFTLTFWRMLTGPERSAEYRFVVDKNEKPISITCPDEVRTPSPEKCTVDDSTPALAPAAHGS